MHDKFANIYDDFTKHIDYKSWYKFLRRYIKSKDSLLDIGCGTGTMADFFQKDGYSVVAVDISKSMLEIAKNKNDKIEYIELNIEKESLDRKFKYIICNFDTVNYLSSLKAFIKNCSKMQEKNSYLIFDVVSEEIFDEMFENDIFIDEEENYTAIWYHEKEKKNKHNIEITVFAKNDKGMYDKFIEKHSKYIYDVENIVEVLNDNGYILHDIAKNEKYGESRFFIIAKK